MADAQVASEGSARLEVLGGETRAFFNPHGRLQRDLTVLCLQEHAQTLRPAGDSYVIVDAMSGTGVRAIRYAKEVGGATRVVANDACPEAANVIRRNCALSGARVEVHCEDATALLRSLAGTVSAVDLDPFGSCAPQLAAAVAALVPGGLLCASCTDVQTLYGVHAAACAARYGVDADPSLAGSHCAPEVALRTLLACIGREGRRCRPLLAVAVDFFVRVFVRVDDGQDGSLAPAGWPSIRATCCPRCGTTWTEVEAKVSIGASCGVCAAPLSSAWGGPYWGGPTCDVAFLAAVRSRCPPEAAEVTGLLASVWHEEGGECRVPWRSFPPAMSQSLPRVSRILWTHFAHNAASGRRRVPQWRKVQEALAEQGVASGLGIACPVAVRSEGSPVALWRAVWTLIAPVAYSLGLRQRQLSKLTPSAAEAAAMAVAEACGVGSAVVEAAPASGPVPSPARPRSLVARHLPTSGLPSCCCGACDWGTWTPFTCTPPAGLVSSASPPWPRPPAVWVVGPRQSAQAAADRARPGDVVVIGPHARQGGLALSKSLVVIGVGSVALVEKRRGDAISVNGNVRVVLCNLRASRFAADTEAATGGHALAARGGARVWVAGCALCSKVGAGVLATAGATVAASRCSLRSSAFQGVFASGKASVLLDHCVITDNGAAGAEARGGAEVRAEGCLLGRNGKAGAYAHAFGRVDLRRCKITANGYAGVEVGARGVAHVDDSLVCFGRRGGVFVVGAGRAEVRGSAVGGHPLASVASRDGGQVYVSEDTTLFATAEAGAGERIEAIHGGMVTRGVHDCSADAT